MPVWCSNCGAMLAEGSEVCPRCGYRLNSDEAADTELSPKEMRHLSLYVLRILLVPILIGLVLLGLCYLIFLN